MDAVVWLLLPLFTAAGSALLSFFIMQARLEVAVSKEREALIEARTIIASYQQGMEDKLRAAEEETRRRSMDDFMADIRVEERHYVKETKSLFANKKSMVLQERLFFRNIPLSNWVEHELTVEEGGEVQAPDGNASIFSAAKGPGGNRLTQGNGSGQLKAMPQVRQMIG
jgi:hypothetical protein